MNLNKIKFNFQNWVKWISVDFTLDLNIGLAR